VTNTAEVDAPPAPPAATAERGLRRGAVYTALFAVGGAAVGSRQLRDNSFMVHLRTGRYILDHGVPHSDPYSFTAPGVKWVAQSWLAELLYGIIDRTVGDFGLRMLGAVIGAVIGALIFTLAYRACGSRGRALALATMTFACVLNNWSERPLMFGLLAMMVLVFVVEFPDAAIARHSMITIPVVMWLWVNVHGTFAFGFLYLLLHLGGRAWDGHPPTSGRERTLLRAGLVAGAVTLINPYGISLPLFPVALMMRSRVLDNVVEWQSPSFRTLGGMFFLVVIVTAFVALTRSKPAKRDLLITIVFLVAGLWAVRNVGLAAVVVLPIIGRSLRPAETPAVDEPSRHNTLALVAVVALAGLLLVNALSVPNWNLESYPVAAMQAVKDRHLLGRHLATTDKWGGYLIATAYPEQRVFFDDRYDMYPLVLDDDYGILFNARPGWARTLDKYGFDVVVWPTRSPLVQLLDLRTDWERIHQDDVATVFVRRSALPTP
jgi:hypothetical protein